jgi:tetratricopeptide (TPR) repeat protein
VPPPRISLCLIVRDEEELLPRFLAHARGAWDELVAVDTGSVDATPRLLAEAGATVLRAPWRQDFAAARNVGLAAATGEWVLVLDPDELISPECGAGVRSVVAMPDAGAATLRMRNPLPHGSVREEKLLRLFRRDRSIRFRKAIHETVGDEVARFVARHGLRVVEVPGTVEHLGYVRARMRAKQKTARDVAILERCLAEDPLDLYRHFKRVEQGCMAADRALWTRAAVGAARAMEAAPARLRAAPFAGEMVALVGEALHAGDPRAELRFLDRWRRRVPPSAALLLRRGIVRERLGLASAREDYERCRALAGTDAVEDRTTVRPLLGLARCALARGDRDGALALAAQARAAAPRDPEALLLSATLLWARGGRAALLGFARDHAASHGATPELHAAVGEAALHAGAVDLAIGALATAAGEPPSGGAGVLLAQALLAAGDVGGARALATRIAAELPEAALGILLCDLVEGRDSLLEIELDPDDADRALRRWVAAVRAAGDGAVVRRLRAAAPAVAPPFGWLASALDPGALHDEPSRA